MKYNGKNKLIKIYVIFLLLALVLCGKALAQTCTPPPSGMVAWFPGDGNAHDISPGNNNNGFVGMQTAFPAGKVAQTFQFNGSSASAITVPDSPSLRVTDALTLDAWINPTAVTGDVMFRGCFGSGNCQPYGLIFNPDRQIIFSLGNNSTFDRLGSVSLIPLNTYTHVAATYDGTTMRIYFNGGLVASKTTTIGTLNTTFTNPLLIGSGPLGTFTGAVDELEIFNRALSQTEIQAIVTADSAGKCKPVVPPPAASCYTAPSGLAAWLPGDNNALDISGNNNNGMLGSQTTFAAGKVAQAFQFNGSSQNASAVTVPDSPSLHIADALTLDAWINPVAGDVVLVKGNLGSGSGQPYSILLDYSGQLARPTFRVGNNTTFDGVQSGSFIPLNAYTHVTGTYDGTKLRIYINGILDMSKTTAIGTLNTINTDPLLIGSGFNGQYAGAVDELEIFNRALSDTEVFNIYNAGNRGKCKPPITSVVNTTSDTNDGVCDTTHCSLREAIIASNNNFTASMPDRIEFNIPGGGTQTIMPTSVLPTITDPVIIDGYTQPGATANTNPTGAINAVLKIELNGAGAGGNVNGLSISASGTTVRGLVINSFTGVAIRIVATSGNLIEGNFIGTNASGTAALGNGNGGIAVTNGSSNNTIGGTTAAARNLISGNAGSIGIGINGSNDHIQGNLIGTDATGTSALGNFFGLVITGLGNNTIGGTTTAARNIISGNVSTGITTGGTAGNIIQGNFIGTDVSGTANLGNGGAGISLSSFFNSNNIIGGTAAGAGNIIAFNGQEGVLVINNPNLNGDNTGNSILSNSIFSNTNLGIDLAPGGVTPNDTGDADTGVNNLQNYPVLSSSSTSGGSTNISGTLNSTAGVQFRIEFFSNAACDSSGFGEGETFIGFQNAMTDTNGNATVSFTPSGAITVGRFITSTATDPAGNTSEFSGCIQNLAPTAAAVSVGGRVATALGRGISKARVSLTDSQGNTRIAQTNPFGYYRFADVQVGETYILSVSAKRYQFENPAQVINLNDAIENVNFTASSEAIKLSLK